MDNVGLETWGGWILAGISTLTTVVLAYIIKPINDRGVRTEQDLTEFKREQDSRLENLRVKQVETETTLRIYVKIQAEVQQALGRIEGNLSQVAGAQSATAASLSRLENEVGEIRRLHMQRGPA